MLWHKKDICFIVQTSRNSSSNSLSSSVKTASQQFLSVCTNFVFGIVSCIVGCQSYFLLFESWQLLIWIFSESVLLHWFCQINNFLPLVCYTMTSHITKRNNCQTCHTINSHITKHNSFYTGLSMFFSIQFFKECFMYSWYFMRQFW